jgi:hypothetical protein
VTLDIFDTQIAARRENDARMFSQALAGLASILEPQAPGHFAELKDAIAEIVASLGGSVPEVPENLTEVNEQLDRKSVV